MSLDILADLNTVTSHQVCRVEILRRERPDLAEQMDRAFAARAKNPSDTRYSDRRIAAWLTEKGFTINNSTIQRHRNRECVRCHTTSSQT